ncbi:cupin domain-containing protein [Mycobacterium sp. M1]|uniref:Cupin domain-containing protein n=2 Tax=Mycolicibacter acidiphilus TaxID=2835306 RepID=A0ABS5RIZ3_9MYCO|nr:cupin domain-containing protein [Mycolicibacter acidiphilus]
MSILRLTLTPDGSPPLHMHTREDEMWVILAGEVKFWTGGQTLADCDSGVVSAGGVAYGPRLVPHTFQTHTPQAEVLIVMTPGGFEDHMLSIGTTADSEKSNSAAEMASFGVTILDRPPIFGQD